MRMTDGQFWSGILVLIGALSAMAIGIILHWHTIMQEELKQEKEKAWRWAQREARRMAMDAVKSARINVKPVLKNESDMKWR